MSTILTIGMPATTEEGHVWAPIIVQIDDVTLTGATVMHQRDNRVWVSTSVDNRPGLHEMLEYSDPRNLFDVIVEEVARFEPVTLPMTTDDVEAICRVAQAIVTNGRRAQ